MSKPQAVRHKTKRKGTMALSDKVLAAVTSRSVLKPVTVTGVRLANEVTLIKALDDLSIDERYQRLRITGEVNRLIRVIRAGGQIPDPIHVVQRPDKSMWIVDGQQRFWAHFETETPIRAYVHRVDDHDAEVNLFLVLNARRKVSAKVMVKGWPGQAGEFIRWAQENDRSPVKGLIDFGTNSKLPLDAPTVIKGVLAATSGLHMSGDMSVAILPRLDAALKVTGAWAWAEEFLKLMAAVFDMNTGAGRVRVLPVIALGRVAHRKFTEAGRPVFPKTCTYLRRTNWDTIVPTHATRFLPLLEGEVEKRWRI